MEYGKWLKEWLDDYVKPTNKSKTYDRYEEIVRLYLLPAFGRRETKDVTPALVQKFVTALLQSGNKKNGTGLAPNSVNAVINVIKCSLKTAFETGYLSEYTADKIKRPKAHEKKVECFTLAEQKKIERAALNEEKDMFFGIVICLYTGLRIGELLALKWEDTDLRKGLLTVKRSCHDAKDENGKTVRVDDTPKTQSSARVIPLPKQLIPLIKAYKKKSGSPYVVSNGRERLLVRSYQDSFTRFLKRAGVGHKGFHSLRHTFATRALECGMDVKTLSEILGHKSPMVTLNRYVHSMMDHKKVMMNKLGKLYLN